MFDGKQVAISYQPHGDSSRLILKPIGYDSKQGEVTTKLVNRALKLGKPYIVNGHVIEGVERKPARDCFMVTHNEIGKTMMHHIHVSPLIHGAMLFANQCNDALVQLYSPEDIDKIFELFKIRTGKVIRKSQLGERLYMVERFLKRDEPIFNLVKERAYF